MDFTYKVMFGVGVLYTLVSFIISGITSAFHLGGSGVGGHGDLVHGGHGGSDIGGQTDGNVAGHTDTSGSHSSHNGHYADAGSSTGSISETFMSWFSIIVNPLVAVSFLTVFGGVGIWGTAYYKGEAILVFVAAVASSVISATLLYKFVAIPLYKAENSTEVSRADLVGRPAEVISKILENGFGEIKYEVNAIRFTAPARHIENYSLEQGTRVVICKIEDNVFYVTELEEIK